MYRLGSRASAGVAAGLAILPAGCGARHVALRVKDIYRGRVSSNVTLRLDRAVAHRGDEIHFTVTNRSERRIDFGGCLAIERAPAKPPDAQCAALIPIGPHASGTFPETICNNDTPGTYAAIFEYDVKGAPVVEGPASTSDGFAATALTVVGGPAQPPPPTC
jgi:hypothetical protein